MFTRYLYDLASAQFRSVRRVLYFMGQKLIFTKMSSAIVRSAFCVRMPLSEYCFETRAPKHNI